MQYALLSKLANQTSRAFIILIFHSMFNITFKLGNFLGVRSLRAMLRKRITAVVFLENTLVILVFFSFVKSKALQGIKHKTPRNIHRRGNDYQMFRGKSSMSCSEVDRKGYSAFEQPIRAHIHLFVLYYLIILMHTEIAILLSSQNIQHHPLTPT